MSVFTAWDFYLLYNTLSLECTVNMLRGYYPEVTLQYKSKHHEISAEYSNGEQYIKVDGKMCTFYTLVNTNEVVPPSEEETFMAELLHEYLRNHVVPKCSIAKTEDSKQLYELVKSVRDRLGFLEYTEFRLGLLTVSARTTVDSKYAVIKISGHFYSAYLYVNDNGIFCDPDTSVSELCHIISTHNATHYRTPFTFIKEAAEEADMSEMELLVCTYEKYGTKTLHDTLEKIYREESNK